MAGFAGFQAFIDWYFNLELFVLVAFGRYHNLVELNLSLSGLLLFAFVFTDNLIAKHDRMLLMSNLSVIGSDGFGIALRGEVNQTVNFLQIFEDVYWDHCLFYQSPLRLIHFCVIIKNHDPKEILAS